jgi:hypothetical protein
MDRTLQPRTRRSFLRGGLLASLALAASLGALPLPDVAANKNDKKPNRIADRVRSQRDLCDIEGGTFDGPQGAANGAKVTTCRGGTQGNRRCVNTPTASFCHEYFEQPDLPTQPLQPVSPIANPLEGGEQPLGSDSPFTVPSQGADQPLEPAGGGVTITAYDGGTAGQATRQGRRHRQGHGKGHKR